MAQSHAVSLSHLRTGSDLNGPKPLWVKPARSGLATATINPLFDGGNGLLTGPKWMLARANIG